MVGKVANITAWVLIVVSVSVAVVSAVSQPRVPIPVEAKTSLGLCIQTVGGVDYSASASYYLIIQADGGWVYMPMEGTVVRPLASGEAVPGLKLECPVEMTESFRTFVAGPNH